MKQSERGKLGTLCKIPVEGKHSKFTAEGKHCGKQKQSRCENRHIIVLKLGANGLSCSVKDALVFLKGLKLIDHVLARSDMLRQDNEDTERVSKRRNSL